MLSRTLGTLALVISTAAAFRDTSPLFLFSNSKLEDAALSGLQLTLSSSVQSKLSEALVGCPSDSYIIVSQPGVTSADFAGKTSAPHLRRWLGGQDEKMLSTVTIPEVFGAVDPAEIASYLERTCAVELVEVDAASRFIPVDNASKKVMKVQYPELPFSSDRASKLVGHDSFLNAILQPLSEQSITVIYTTTPPSSDYELTAHHAAPTYEMDDPYPSAVHMDLKRDVSARADNSTLESNLPLFERYQFLSPGIFMGFLVSLILFLILYVGISAVSSLEVSYFAFSKEMGPAAQKKQG